MGACNCKTLGDEPKSASEMTAAAAVNGSHKASKPPPLNHLVTTSQHMHNTDPTDTKLLTSCARTLLHSFHR